MPLLGAHQSIAGGYHQALIRAGDIGCEAVQLFTKSNNQWKAKEITRAEAALFHKSMRVFKLRASMAHASYLINLASPTKKLYLKSIGAFFEEYRRAEQLRLRYLVIHPGAHMGAGAETGLRRVAAALDEIFKLCPSYRARVLLENTAGQGSSLGHHFEHLAHILSSVRESHRLGICFDTCHAVAAGYSMATADEYKRTMQDVDTVVGLRRVWAFHLNDSLRPLGSRVDRHAHIGEGYVGLEGFRQILNDSRFRHRPMVLETPKESRHGEDMDKVNLRLLRSLLA
jgi:deoxyribonuclease-4